MVRGGIVTDLPRGRLPNPRTSPAPATPATVSAMLPLATGPIEVACICCTRECHIICTVLVRSSLLENTHRISCIAWRHASTSSVDPDSLASRTAAKKQPSRTRDASYSKNAVPRFSLMTATTLRASRWHRCFAFSCKVAMWLRAWFKASGDPTTRAGRVGEETSLCCNVSRI